MADAPLHPGLQKQLVAHRRLLRLLNLPIFLAMAAAMVFAMATALRGGTLGNLLLLALIGGVVLFIVISLGGLLWWLDHWMVRRLTDANRLLQQNRPITARLTPTGSTRPGILMAMHRLDQRTVRETGYVLIEPFLGGTGPLRQDLTVQLYCQDLQPDSRLVALHDGKALLGKLVDRQKYHRQRQLIMIALAAALLLVAIAIFLRT